MLTYQYWCFLKIKYSTDNYHSKVISLPSITTETINALGEKMYMRICSELILVLKDIYEQLKYKKMSLIKIKIGKYSTHNGKEKL